MEHLFSHWEKIKSNFNGQHIFLFLDYDGTLTPIVSTPQAALLSEEHRSLLRRLSQAAHCRVAIISGRAVDDLRKRVGVQDIIYVGNHGFEIEESTINFESLIADWCKEVFGQIKDEFNAEFDKNKIEGVLVEDKGLTLTIHYRLVSEQNMPLLESLFNKVTAPYVAHKKIKVGTGNKVFEIRPPVEWDKGKALLWLLAREKFKHADAQLFPICIGDDTTDEDAFKTLEKKGMAVLVGGERPSYAHYYLKDTGEVIQFLEELEKVLRGGSHGKNK